MSGGASDGLSEKAELQVGYRLPPDADGLAIEREAMALARLDSGTQVVTTRASFEPPVRTAKLES